MKALGLDPGTVRMGYGIVESAAVGGDHLHLVDCGVLRAPAKAALGKRLHTLYHSLEKLMAQYSLDAVAIEEPFVAKDVRAAMAIGEARAVAVLAAYNRHVPVFSYAPMQIKRAVTSYGASSKEQVQQMVQMLLGLGGESLPLDASDALAVAICHLLEGRLARMLQSRQVGMK